MSQHYTASIGKSTYEIPYESHEDLPLLKSICADVNRLINTIISSNQLISNEFALVLALLNIVYETGYSVEKSNEINNVKAKNDASPHNLEVNQQEFKQYSTQDILAIIEYIRNNTK